MKKLTIVALALAMLTACGPKTLTGTAEKDVDGEKIAVEVTLEGDKVTEITIDETYKGSTKRTLGNDYGMSSIGKDEWYVQVDALQEYIIANGVDAVTLDANGYSDVVTGCTINLANIMETVNAAIDAAE